MIYVKTELGQTAFKTRSISLTPGQRAAFILFDGKRDSVEVLSSTAGLGVAQADLEHLVALGMLVSSAISPAPESPFTLAPAGDHMKSPGHPDQNVSRNAAHPTADERTKQQRITDVDHVGHQPVE